ncbi:MAG: hypothetical protein IJR50_03155, partial [Treponema sp.]|nr:hypothetical protein [Treponema sp.]
PFFCEFYPSFALPKFFFALPNYFFSLGNYFFALPKFRNLSTNTALSHREAAATTVPILTF